MTNFDILDRYDLWHQERLIEGNDDSIEAFKRFLTDEEATDTLRTIHQIGSEAIESAEPIELTGYARDLLTAVDMMVALADPYVNGAGSEIEEAA